MISHRQRRHWLWLLWHWVLHRPCSLPYNERFCRATPPPLLLLIEMRRQQPSLVFFFFFLTYIITHTHTHTHIKLVSFLNNSIQSLLSYTCFQFYFSFLKKKNTHTQALSIIVGWSHLWKQFIKWSSHKYGENITY